MSDYMTRNASALRSYDAMLARGDGRGDEPTYSAPVRIDGMVVPEGKNEAAVREDLQDRLSTIDSLKMTTDDGTTWVDVEGTLEEVQADAEEDEKADLWKALEELGYEPDGVTVQSYQEAVLDWQD